MQTSALWEAPLILIPISVWDPEKYRPDGWASPQLPAPPAHKCLQYVAGMYTCAHIYSFFFHAKTSGCHQVSIILYPV